MNCILLLVQRLFDNIKVMMTYFRKETNAPVDALLPESLNVHKIIRILMIHC
jgi:hypothetical protein